MINYSLVKDNPIIIGDKKFANVVDFIKFLADDVSILDRQERRYIKNVVRPFWKRVKYVVKMSMLSECGGEYIKIVYDDAYDGYENIENDMVFPIFPQSSMYKGMQMYKRYTLDDLGITFKN